MDYKNRHNRHVNYQRPISPSVVEPVSEITEPIEQIDNTQIDELPVVDESVENIPEESNESASENTTALRPVVVTVNKLNIREIPKVPSKVVTIVSKNETLLSADSLDKEWIYVETTPGVTGSGFTGYVMSAYVRD